MWWKLQNTFSEGQTQTNNCTLFLIPTKFMIIFVEFSLIKGVIQECVFYRAYSKRNMIQNNPTNVLSEQGERIVCNVL